MDHGSRDPLKSGTDKEAESADNGDEFVDFLDGHAGPGYRGLFLLTSITNSVKKLRKTMMKCGRSCIAAFMACAFLLLITAPAYSSTNREAEQKYTVACQRLENLRKSKNK